MLLRVVAKVSHSVEEGHRHIRAEVVMVKFLYHKMKMLYLMTWKHQHQGLAQNSSFRREFQLLCCTYKHHLGRVAIVSIIIKICLTHQHHHNYNDLSNQDTHHLC